MAAVRSGNNVFPSKEAALVWNTRNKLEPFQVKVAGEWYTVLPGSWLDTTYGIMFETVDGTYHFHHDDLQMRHYRRSLILKMKDAKAYSTRQEAEKAMLTDPVAAGVYACDGCLMRVKSTVRNISFSGATAGPGNTHAYEDVVKAWHVEREGELLCRRHLVKSLKVMQNWTAVAA